jgi:hypothetical protein
MLGGRMSNRVDFGRKHRSHQVNVSCSASGPGFTPSLEENGRFLRPRMAADLRYTTADADFLNEYWRDSWDRGETTTALRSRDPGIDEFWERLSEACDWLSRHSASVSWIGGGLSLTFAGHGRYPDGALVLRDGSVGAEDLATFLEELWERLPARAGNLRVALKLDSCYSGAFLLHWLEHVYASDLLVPYFSHVSSMPDEVSWEDSSLGHGLFTFCISHSGHPGELVVEAVQPDNLVGKSLRLAAHEFGCARLTVGEQNPIRYIEYDQLQVLGRTVDIADLLPVPSASDLEARLLEVRKDLQPLFKILEPEMSMNGRFTDEDAVAGIRDTLESLANTST